MFSRQFDPPHGDPDDKAALIDQLRLSFRKRDLRWLEDPDIQVRRTTVAPSDIDWDHRESWAATHEPKLVKEKRNDIKHGDMKPVVVVDRPHHDDLMVMDGHHHTEAYTQLIGQRKGPKALRSGRFPAYEVSVPRTSGPWDELHSKQEHNPNA